MNDLTPLDQAAKELGIEPKRLLGFMMRNGLGDPIGGQTEDGIMVYEWSLDGLRKRLAAAVTSTPSIYAVPNGGQST